MKSIDLALLITSLALETCLAVNLLRRRVYREFPAFVVYTCYSVLAIAARLLVIGQYGRYFFVYWATYAAFALLEIWVLHEVFRWIFAAFYTLWWFWLFFPGIIATAALISIETTLRHPPIQVHPAVAQILSFGLAVNYVQMGLFGLFYVLIKFFGSRFWQYAFGIMLGLAASAIGTVIPYALRSEFGTRFNPLLNYLPTVAYLIGLLFWLDAFVRCPPPTNEDEEWYLTANPQELLRIVRNYTAAVNKFRVK